MSCDSNKDQVKKERTNRISSYDRLIELRHFEKNNHPKMQML